MSSLTELAVADFQRREKRRQQQRDDALRSVSTVPARPRSEAEIAHLRARLAGLQAGGSDD